jgi:hypothetical protein
MHFSVPSASFWFAVVVAKMRRWVKEWRVLFRDYFDGVDAGIVHYGDKREDQLSLGVWLQSVKDLVDSTLQAAGLSGDVKILQQCLAIAVNVKQTLFGTHVLWMRGAEIRFGELEREPVVSLRHGDRVGEVPVPFTLIQLVVCCGFHRVETNDRSAATEKTVGFPQSLVLG